MSIKSVGIGPIAAAVAAMAFLRIGPLFSDELPEPAAVSAAGAIPAGLSNPKHLPLHITRSARHGGFGESKPRTVGQWEQLALLRSPTVALAVRRVEALRGKYRQVGFYPNPTIGYAGEEIGNEGHAGQQGLAVGQHLVTGGKLQWNRSVVGSEIAAAEQERAMQRLRVTNDVRVAAYGVMATQQTVDISEELLHLAEQGLHTAEHLFAAQEVSRVDVLQARLEVHSTRLAVQKARHAVAQQWRQLALLVGVPDLTPAPLADEAVGVPSPIAGDDALARLLRDSPERMRAAAEVERARAAVGRECAGRVPNVELRAGVRYNFGSKNTLATLGMAMPLQLFDATRETSTSLRTNWRRLTKNCAG